MIPKKLVIQGLYSYQTKQVIDFDKLTAGGLFGIFGAVGSGKSSILEAILLALYGSTERLSVTGERSSMVNLQSDELLVSLEFKAGKANSEQFLARYAVKRNKKNPDKIDTGEHSLYRWTDGEWEAIAQSAEEILGMKKEHFKQTVIIPQGKFRDFIDQKPKDQAVMMKELFGLQRFDLSAQTSHLTREVKDELIRLHTQMEGLAQVSNELLAEKKEAEKALQSALQENIKSLGEVESRQKALEKTREKKNELLGYLNELELLESQKADIERQKKHHARFISAKHHIKPLWERRNSLTLNLEKTNREIIECTRWVSHYEQEIFGLQAKLQQIEARQKDKPRREAKIRDLQYVLHLQELQTQLTASKTQVEQLLPQIEAVKLTQKETLSKSKTLETQVEKLDLPSSQDLADWKSWIQQEDYARSLLRKIETQTATLQKSKEECLAEQTKLQSKIPSDFQNLAEWKNQSEEDQGKLEHQLTQLKELSGLTAHAHLLEDGKPCPLCGAEAHPAPLSGDHTEQKTQALQSKITQVKTTLDQIKQLESSETRLQLQLNQVNGDLKTKAIEAQELKESLRRLKEKLSAAHFDSWESLRSKTAALDQDFETERRLRAQIKELRAVWEAVQMDLETREKEFQKSQRLFDQIQNTIQNKKQEIRDWSFAQTFLTKSSQEVQTTIDQVQVDIDTAEEQLQSAQKHLSERKQAQTENATSLKLYQSRLTELQQEEEKVALLYEEKKSELGFQDESELLRLFQDAIDEEKVALSIRKFEDRYHLLSSRISELQALEEIKQYDQSQYDELTTRVEEIKEALETQKAELTLIQQEISSLLESLKTKKDLTQRLQVLELREANLKELERLFHGSGFVKYVSSIYLQELCHTANTRFMKLTKNQLSLAIDEDNTFWVIDYLNGGKRRLLKTLSGGQTFQASLCLALALAEKIKSLNMADQSFFFMDEGFGALDKRSLGVVFDTLKSLQFENRVVGIISHVEELQQEIGVYAQVHLDPEKGSQVTYSF
ncbi:AAA family ATPase [Algoriphagus namhaensis]